MTDCTADFHQLQADCLMNVTWFLLPLAAAVSFVWNASRYESTELILSRSTRMFVQIIVFMAIFLGLLALLSYKL